MSVKLKEINVVGDGTSTSATAAAAAYSLRINQHQTRHSSLLPSTGAFCDEGHQLQEIRWSNLRAEGTYNQRFFCDLCRKENGIHFNLLSDDVILHCNECLYDVCPNCLKRRRHLLLKAAKIKGKKSHMQFKTPTESRFEHLHCVNHCSYHFNMRQFDVTVDSKQLLSSGDFTCRTCKERGCSSEVFPGESLLICASPTCSNTICLECAEFLIRKEREPPLELERTKLSLDFSLKNRYCRHSHQMKAVVFANLKSRPDSSGTGFVCEYCQTWFEKPDPETLLFQCEDCSTYQCCKCFFLTKPRNGLPSVQSSRLKQTISAEKLQSRLDSALLRRQEKGKSILPFPQELPEESTFQMIEIRLHRISKLPDCIVYEIERRSLRQAEESLCPFVKSLLKYCKWPIHTSLRIIALCRNLKNERPETSEILECEIEKLEKISFDMLNVLDFREVATLFKASSPTKHMYRIKPLLTLAMEANHKRFLAHKSVHQVFRSQWEHSVLPIKEDSTNGLLFTSYMIWNILSFFLYIFNWLSVGFLARYSLKSFEKHRWLAAILGPLNKEKPPLSVPISNAVTANSVRNRTPLYRNRPRFWLESWAISYKRKWRISASVRFRFCVHLLSYCGFLALASFCACQTTTKELNLSEFALAIWVIGLFLQEIEQIKHSGFSTHYRDFWSKVDIFHCLTYVVFLGCKFSASFIPNQEISSKLLASFDSIFACVIIVSYVRILYAFQAFRSVGPLLVVFGKMVGDVMRFLILIIVVVSGFAFGLFKLSVSNKIQNSSSSSSSESLLNSTIPLILTTTHNSEKTAMNIGTSFIQTITSLYYAIVGQTEFTFESGYKEILGTALFAIFMILTTMVLLNLLIAMMSSSFQRVEEQADYEWKARFACVVDRYSKISVIPAPINIISCILWVCFLPCIQITYGCQSLIHRFDRSTSARRSSVAKYILDENENEDEDLRQEQNEESQENESNDEEQESFDDSDYVDQPEGEEEDAEESNDLSTTLNGSNNMNISEVRHEISDELKALHEEAIEQQQEEDEELEKSNAKGNDWDENIRFHRDTTFARYVHGISRELFQEGLEAEASARQRIAGILKSQENRHLEIAAPTGANISDNVAQQLQQISPVRSRVSQQQNNNIQETKDLLREAVSSLLTEWTLTKVEDTQQSTHKHKQHQH